MARKTTARSAEIKDIKCSGGKAVMRPPDDPVTATELSELAAEFPGYEFARQQRWGGGVSVVARRRGGCARPGLYVVVSDDLDEMRRALLEQERSQLPA